MTLSSLLLAAALIAAVPAPPPGQSQEDAPLVTDYLVSLPEHQAHRVHVRLRAHDLDGDSVDLALPVWTPGSYLVREFSRHVLDLAAATPDGAPLPARKVAKNTWRVELGGATEAVVDYVLYANELSVRTSQVDADHAFLSPASTFLRVRGREDQPHRVRVDAPEGWGVYTSLREEQGADGSVWIAEHYDELVDSPLEVGPHRVEHFTVNGVPHRLVVAGAGEVDMQQLTDDLRRVSEEVASVFGNMPFGDYTVLLLLTDGPGGGLEHRNSNVSMVNRWALTDEDRYRRLISLLAHEYFHAWNVKRFRPAALGPFDYDEENYTGDLWVAEGITSYYDDLCTLRAGFADNVGKYLEARGDAFQREAQRPGSERMSLVESSWDAWIKLYRPDENSTNSSISYYSKGALVALMLDLRLQRLSDGRVGLRDVLRLGWERYAARDVGFPEGAFEELVADTLGRPLTEFFDDYVRGTAPLEPNEDLAWVGVELVREAGGKSRELPLDIDDTPLEPWLGISTEDQRGLVRVQSVLEGSPAYRAGLNHDDILLAVDDMRVDPGSFQDRLDRLAGRESIELTLFRGQRLRRITVQPEQRPVHDWKLRPLEQVDDATRERFAAWTGWDHPSVKDAGYRGDRPSAQPPAEAPDDALPAPAEQR